MQRNLTEGWQQLHSGHQMLYVRWLLNPGEPPQENCRLVIEDGVLTDIRPAGVGDGAVPPLMLVPPLVNAHTHLEFSALNRPLEPATPFTDWIRSVLRWRREVSATAAAEQQSADGTASDPQQAAVRVGLRESEERGVQLVGEIATSNPVRITQIRPRCLFFREVIGLQPSRIMQQWSVLKSFLELRPEIEAAGGRVGISPHAPYTVHPDFLQQLAATAQRDRLPLAMHLGETREERELLERGTGPFADFLRSLELFDAELFCGGRRFTEYLEQLTLAPQALAIHGNWFERPEWDYLQRHPTISVVYCPRTHHWFGHPPYPLQAMLSAGVRVVLGTDSRASNPDHGIWNELQHVLRHHPAVDPLQVLGMITTSAAAALGWPEASQPLRPGIRLTGTLLECPVEKSSLRAELCGSRVLLGVSGNPDGSPLLNHAGE